METKQEPEYIWYCPRTRCHVILFKTREPILQRGKVRCYRCGTIFEHREIEACNKHNMGKYLKTLDKIFVER